MKAQIIIKDESTPAKNLTISVDCDNVQDIEQVLTGCAGFLPRKKVFGII